MSKSLFVGWTVSTFLTRSLSKDSCWPNLFCYLLYIHLYSLRTIAFLVLIIMPYVCRLQFISWFYWSTWLVGWVSDWLIDWCHLLVCVRQGWCHRVYLQCRFKCTPLQRQVVTMPTTPPHAVAGWWRHSTGCRRSVDVIRDVSCCVIFIIHRCLRPANFQCRFLRCSELQ